jgi:hypothetical protein
MFRPTNLPDNNCPGGNARTGFPVLTNLGNNVHGWQHSRENYSRVFSVMDNVVLVQIILSFFSSLDSLKLKPWNSLFVVFSTKFAI